MSNKIEYSRFRFKRSTVNGVEPTIPTATTIDNTWLATDLLIGEGFINVEDDKFWFRTNNGLVEVSLSGISSDNYYTELAYLSGNTLIFDRNDTLNAYNVDLSPILTGATGGDAVWFSGDSGTYSIQSYLGSAQGNYAIAAGTSTGTSEHIFVAGSLNYISGSTTFAHGDSHTSGAQYGTLLGQQHSTLGNHTFAQGYNHTIEGSTNQSAILGGSGNFIASGVDRAVVLGGTGLSATTDDTVYVDNLNIATLGAGTVVNNLGLDANGNVVAAAGGISGDTTLGELSATSISILNSGATAREYFDYSSNTVETGVTNSAIVAGSGNTISSGLRNVFVSGVDLTASANDTAYFSNIQTDDVIKSSGGAEIDMNGLGGSDNVLITTDSGAYAEGVLFMSSNPSFGTEVSSYNGRVYSYAGTNTQLDAEGNFGISSYNGRLTLDGEEIRVTSTFSGTTAAANLMINSEGYVMTGGALSDFSFAISDETTAITTGATKLTFYAPYAMNVTNVYASLSTSGSTSSQFDINNNGTTILSTPITIDANEFHSKDAATPPVISASTISQFDKITVDIDTAGTSAAGAKIYIVGTKA